MKRSEGVARMSMETERPDGGTRSGPTTTQGSSMLRTLFMIGLFAIGGLFLLKVLFGVFGVFFALLLTLLRMAIFVTLVGAAIYLVVRILSPDTARRMREKWSGTAM